MPTRYIKETIRTSDNLNTLSPMAENLFYRLIVTVDDFGCYYGDASIVRSTCFPMKADVIKSDQVQEWIRELEKAGLIRTYTAADGRNYLQFQKWNQHQNARAQKPKYPLPEDDCIQLQADVNKCARNSKRISETEPESETNIRNRREYEQDRIFEEFWNIYPQKTGRIESAYMEYLHATDTAITPEELLKAVKEQVEGWKDTEPRYIPSAEKWLRNQGWKGGGGNAGRKPDKSFSGKGRTDHNGEQAETFQYDV